MEKDSVDRVSLCALIGLLLTLVCASLGTTSAFTMTIIVLLSILAYRKTPLPIEIPDIALWLFCLLTCISSLWTIAPAAALKNNMLIILTAYVYYLACLCSNNECYRRWIIKTVAVTGLIIALITLITFAYLKTDLINVGFLHYYPFRHMLRPMGLINNAWAEAALLFTGFAMMVRRYKPFLLFIITFSGLITFCRGFYVALLFMVLVRTTYSHRRAVLTQESIPIIASITTVVILFSNDISLMMSRSTNDEWRRMGVELITKTDASTIFGLGSGSAAKYIDCINGISETYTDTTPNAITEVLINYGITGAVLLAIFFTCLFWRVCKHIRRGENSIILSMIIALGIKEMTQSTLTAAPLCLILTAIALGVITKPSSRNHITIPSYYIVAIAPVLSIFNLTKPHTTTNDKIDPYPQLITAANYFDNGEYEKAILTARTSPHSLYSDFTIAESQRRLNISSPKNDSIRANAIYHHPRLVDLTILTDSDKTYLLNHIPQTSIATDLARIGYLCHKIGNESIANKYLNQSVAIQPSLTTPWLILGDTARYRLLSGNQHLISDTTFKKLTGILENTYYVRRQHWYGHRARNKQ